MRHTAHFPQPFTGDYQVVPPLHTNCIPDCYLNIMVEQLFILSDAAGTVYPSIRITHIYHSVFSDNKFKLNFYKFPC